jgi:hypothetical protein
MILVSFLCISLLSHTSSLPALPFLWLGYSCQCPVQNILAEKPRRSLVARPSLTPIQQRRLEQQLFPAAAEHDSTTLNPPAVPDPPIPTVAPV